MNLHASFEELLSINILLPFLRVFLDVMDEIHAWVPYVGLVEWWNFCKLLKSNGHSCHADGHNCNSDERYITMTIQTGKTATSTSSTATLTGTTAAGKGTTTMKARMTWSLS